MRELAGDQVNDGHQMIERAKAPCSGDGGLDLGVERLGGSVGQVERGAVDDTGQVVSQGRAETFEGRKPVAAAPS